MRNLLRSYTDPITYGVGVGRVKVLETRLLDHHRLERLVGAETFDETMRVLFETEYGQLFEGVAYTEVSIEEALTAYCAHLYKFLEELCPNPNLVSFFLLKYDFHNLKILLKTKYSGARADINLSPLGRLSIEVIRMAISQEKIGDLPPLYRFPLEQSIKRFEETKDPQVIDTILDRELYSQLYQLALEEKRKFLLEFVQISIDLVNLKTFLRAKVLRKEREFLEEALIGYGTVKKEWLIHVFDQSWETIIRNLAKTPYDAVITEILESFRETQQEIDLSLFDPAADNFLLDYAKKAKFISVGVEPIVGYILAKENEIKIVRNVLSGKLAGLPIKIIRERLRKTYV